MKLDLSNKNILITGAATGMGRASAIETAKHGANVAIVDVNSGGLEEVSKELIKLFEMGKRADLVVVVEKSKSILGFASYKIGSK